MPPRLVIKSWLALYRINTALHYDRIKTGENRVWGGGNGTSFALSGITSKFRRYIYIYFIFANRNFWQQNSRILPPKFRIGEQRKKSSKLFLGYCTQTNIGFQNNVAEGGKKPSTALYIINGITKNFGVNHLYLKIGGKNSFSPVHGCLIGP